MPWLSSSTLACASIPGTRLTGDSTSRARLLDPRGLVDLVAEGGHLEPAAGHHLPDVQARPPMHTHVEQHRLGIEREPALGDALGCGAGGVADLAPRIDRRARRGRLRAELLGDEERADTVAGVLAHDPAPMD